MQNKINPFALKQKLTRHKLRFSYDDGSNTLKLGGIANRAKSWLLSVVLPLSISMLVLAATYFEWIPLFDKGRAVAKLIGYMVGIPFAIGLIGIFRVALKNKRNTGKKIISPKGVIIESRTGHSLVLNSEHIKAFDYTVTFDNAACLGELVVITTEGARYTILGIEEDKATYLKDDLEYLKSFLEELVGIK